MHISYLIAVGLPKDTELHIIDTEIDVTQANIPFVHHFILTASNETNENEIEPIPMESCDGNLTITETCIRMGSRGGNVCISKLLGEPTWSEGISIFQVGNSL
jgi:hypothetical protein